MCGLICVYKKEEKFSTDFEGKVRGSLRKLNHRGPDENDVLTFDHAVFGHTRLSIVDLKTGHQRKGLFPSNEQQNLQTYT